MTWIRTVNEDDATGELKAIYDASVKAYGWIPNIRKALSLSPKALRHYTQLSASVYSSGPLPEVEREMIATVVSVVNHCHYWTESHAEFLRRATKDDQLVEALKTDWRSAPLTPRQQALLAYSEKLTRTPSEMTEEDVASLRTAGLTDEEILAVIWVAGFFNLATRIADALGVELDREHIPGTPEYERIMSRSPAE